MKEQVISFKYAQALFNIGYQNNCLEQIKTEINELLDILNDNKNLKNVLFHPLIKPKDKKIILDKLFKDKVLLYTLNFLKLLIDNKREKLISFIVKSFNSLIENYSGLEEGTVVTAVELEDSLKQLIVEHLEKYFNKKLNITFEVNTEILGGILIKVGDRLIDASLSSQLDRLLKSIN